MTMQGTLPSPPRTELSIRHCLGDIWHKPERVHSQGSAPGWFQALLKGTWLTPWPEPSMWNQTCIYPQDRELKPLVLLSCFRCRNKSSVRRFVPVRTESEQMEKCKLLFPTAMTRTLHLFIQISALPLTHWLLISKVSCLAYSFLSKLFPNFWCQM